MPPIKDVVYNRPKFLISLARFFKPNCVESRNLAARPRVYHIISSVRSC